MNAAAAANGSENGGAEIRDLREQRDQLLGEVARLREQRNAAIAAANRLQVEIAALKRRIAELENPST